MTPAPSRASRHVAKQSPAEPERMEITLSDDERHTATKPQQPAVLLYLAMHV